MKKRKRIQYIKLACEHLTQCIELIEQVITGTDLEAIYRGTLINSLNDILDGQIISLKSLQTILNDENLNNLKKIEYIMQTRYKQMLEN